MAPYVHVRINVLTAPIILCLIYFQEKDSKKEDEEEEEEEDGEEDKDEETEKEKGDKEEEESNKDKKGKKEDTSGKSESGKKGKKSGICILLWEDFQKFSCSSGWKLRGRFVLYGKRFLKFCPNDCDLADRLKTF